MEAATSQKHKIESSPRPARSVIHRKPFIYRSGDRDSPVLTPESTTSAVTSPLDGDDGLTARAALTPPLWLGHRPVRRPGPAPDTNNRQPRISNGIGLPGPGRGAAGTESATRHPKLLGGNLLRVFDAWKPGWLDEGYGRGMPAANVRLNGRSGPDRAGPGCSTGRNSCYYHAL
jgi:hypothetical protein